jgi:hypothetical protein
MNEVAKKIFFLDINSPTKVHFNYLIARSFNNIGRFFVIIKPFNSYNSPTLLFTNKHQLFAHESQFPFYASCKFQSALDGFDSWMFNVVGEGKTLQVANNMFRVQGFSWYSNLKSTWVWTLKCVCIV